MLLPRDHYVRVDANDYSVHPGVIGHRIEVVTDLHRVRISTQEGLWANTSGLGRHQAHSPVPPGRAKALRRGGSVVRPGPPRTEVAIPHLGD